jgi:lipid A 3-O-deacylase
MNATPVIHNLERSGRTRPHPMNGIPDRMPRLHPFPSMSDAGHRPGRRLLPILLFVGVLSTGAQNPGPTNAPSQAAPSVSASTNVMAASKLRLEATPESIWENGIGEGFRSKTESLTVSAGATYGIAAFGSREQHHLAMGSLTYGHMLGGVVGEGHWYRGNPEFRLEVFSGAQFDPGTRWFVGLTPHLRYNFATGTRWIPFADAGAGVTATSIGPPDLSGTFEFNLQAGTGVQYFLEENLALTLEARYVHWSCAGLHQPNSGLNGVTGLLGITYFF